MAPEVFRHEKYTEKVDLYSWSMILYNMLTGYSPFPTLDGLSACKAAAIQGERPDIPGSLAPRLRELLCAAWDGTESRRPPFSAVLQTLNEVHVTAFKVNVEHDSFRRPRERSGSPLNTAFSSVKAVLERIRG